MHYIFRKIRDHITSTISDEFCKRLADELGIDVKDDFIESFYRIKAIYSYKVAPDSTKR